MLLKWCSQSVFKWFVGCKAAKNPWWLTQGGYAYEGLVKRAPSFWILQYLQSFFTTKTVVVVILTFLIIRKSHWNSSSRETQNTPARMVWDETKRGPLFPVTLPAGTRCLPKCRDWLSPLSRLRYQANCDESNQEKPCEKIGEDHGDTSIPAHYQISFQLIEIVFWPKTNMMKQQWEGCMNVRVCVLTWSRIRCFAHSGEVQKTGETV